MTILQRFYRTTVIVYCPLPIAYCLLPIVYCLLPIAFRNSHRHDLFFFRSKMLVNSSNIFFS